MSTCQSCVIIGKSQTDSAAAA